MLQLCRCFLSLCSEFRLSSVPRDGFALSDCDLSCVTITKTRLFKYIENFTTQNWKFSDKNSDIFHLSAQNMDCGYSLKPPLRGDSNEYMYPQSMFLSRNKKKKHNIYPCKPQVYHTEVWFKGVKII